MTVAVSILIRPEGRMQRLIMRIIRPRGKCFNPHPARRPDATPNQLKKILDFGFQSSSGQKAGCNLMQIAQ